MPGSDSNSSLPPEGPSRLVDDSSSCMGSDDESGSEDDGDSGSDAVFANNLSRMAKSSVANTFNNAEALERQAAAAASASSSGAQVRVPVGQLQLPALERAAASAAPAAAVAGAAGTVGTPVSSALMGMVLTCECCGITSDKALA